MLAHVVSELVEERKLKKVARRFVPAKIWPKGNQISESSALEHDLQKVNERLKRHLTATAPLL
jgi:hypothetical protein